MTIPSQLSSGDVKKLQAIQNLIKQTQSYVYLEIGSYLGGSLYPHLLEKKCTAAWSVDKRSTDPILDERNIDYAYSVTTKHMLDLLTENNVPVSRLHTVDGTVQSVPPIQVDLVFIDGEHTNQAAYSDAVSSMRFQPQIIMFHDDWIVSDAIDQFQQYLRDQQQPADVYKLTDSDITVVVFGAIRNRFAAFAKNQSQSWQTFVPQARSRLKKGKTT